MSLTRRIHHVAYRCNDARETVEFYRDVLGMEFTVAFAEDRVPSTGEHDPYMHVFLDAGGGNVLAFFELPTRPPMGRDPNTPQWVQHIAFEVADLTTLTLARTRLVDRGIEVAKRFTRANKLGQVIEICHKQGTRLVSTKSFNR